MGGFLFSNLELNQLEERRPFILLYELVRPYVECHHFLQQNTSRTDKSGFEAFYWALQTSFIRLLASGCQVLLTNN